MARRDVCGGCQRLDGLDDADKCRDCARRAMRHVAQLERLVLAWADDEIGSGVALLAAAARIAKRRAK